jgi:hypothetical protein
MSETTEIPPLDPIAFVAALILAPLLFTLLTFWALLIPVGALLYGGIPYLVLGTPILLMMLLGGPCTVNRMANAAMITIAGLYVGLASIAIFQPHFLWGLWALFAVFSLAFAAAWAATFAILYNRFYHHPAA